MSARRGQSQPMQMAGFGGPVLGQGPSRPLSAKRLPRPSSAQRLPTSGRPGISQQISTDQNSRQVICFCHLRGRCALGESCRNYHADLPYQWVYRHQGDVEWQVLPAPANLELELAYSDPDNQEFYMDIDQKVKIVFKTMTGTSIDGHNYDLHRFSTASSVEFERQPLTTEWVWYWKDEIGQWRKYGEDNTIGYKADISSTHLEQAYIANPEGNLAFSKLGHEYILDFPKMVQRNLHNKTERDVCRRPVSISKQDFEQKRIQAPSGRRSGQIKGVASGVGMVTAPPNWKITPGSDIMDIRQIVKTICSLPREENCEKMFAYAIIPKTKREEDVIRSVNVILARERKPMTLGEICHLLGGVSPAELQSIAFQNPSNFECFEDGQLYVKQITRVGTCELHTSKNKTCPGSIPFCTGLHICKFYILSGQCPFGGQCTFGHDLTISHNMKILKENYLECVTGKDLKYLFSRAESRTSVTIPKICKFYNVDAGCRYSESGKDCPNLHICKHYVLDKCRFGRSCRRSHNIISRDIKAILEKHGISTRRTPKEILADLREAVMRAGSDGSSVGSSPLVRCFSDINISPSGDGYISNSGDNEGSVMFQQQGRRGRNKKAKPKVPADLPRPMSTQRGQSQPMQISGYAGPVSGQGPSRPLSANFKRLPRPFSARRPPTSGRPGISQQISTDQNSRQVICFFHLRGRCLFGESCRNFHADLPYQWVYRHQGDVEWQVLPASANLELELTYSDPDNQEFYMDIDQKVKIVFKTMTGTSIDGQNYDVHRFSTTSSVELERQPLTTEWVWYWKDQIGQWRKYGEDNITRYKADISSTHLEQAYIANPEGNLAFSTLGHEYILDFPKMVQRNLQHKTEREVCRRPVFISKQDFEQKRIQVPSGRVSGQIKGVASGVGRVTAPPNWKITPGSDIMDHCQIVEVSEKDPATRKEYKEIESLFCESMPSTVSVKSIERVENGELWCNYVSKKARMLKKNDNRGVGERRLFHGTPNTYVDAICRQGFDFRLSGQTSGTKYGKGSYFATTSKYSDCYTDQTNRVMFVVKVLVGEYAKGDSKYVRPPSKDKNNPCSELYDSCVDDKKNPSIFVIFDNSGQVYPEYLIRYEYKYV